MHKAAHAAALKPARPAKDADTKQKVRKAVKEHALAARGDADEGVQTGACQAVSHKDGKRTSELQLGTADPDSMRHDKKKRRKHRQEHSCEPDTAGNPVEAVQPPLAINAGQQAGSQSDGVAQLQHRKRKRHGGTRGREKISCHEQ